MSKKVIIGIVVAVIVIFAIAFFATKKTRLRSKLADMYGLTVKELLLSKQIENLNVDQLEMQILMAEKLKASGTIQ
jgi:hypothetical protein